MNKPREGNRPGISSSEPKETIREERHSLTRKLESGLAEPQRNTGRNRHLAQINGWTELEYLHWVDTGDPPIRSVVRSTEATRSDEIDDDERLHQ
jgi:hypothetical protein